MSAAQDVLVGFLALARTLALGRLSPRRNWMPATGRPALAAAMRMIDRVHRDAAHRRPAAEPATAARLAELDVAVVRVGHRPDRCHALRAHHPLLARLQ